MDGERSWVTKGFFALFVCFLKIRKITTHFYADRSDPTGKTGTAGENRGCWENIVEEVGGVEAKVKKLALWRSTDGSSVVRRQGRWEFM